MKQQTIGHSRAGFTPQGEKHLERIDLTGKRPYVLTGQIVRSVIYLAPSQLFRTLDRLYHAGKGEWLQGKDVPPRESYIPGEYVAREPILTGKTRPKYSVFEVTQGKLYASIKAAAKACKVSDHSIRESHKSGKKVKGLQFELRENK